jgi:uncharacterized protein (TIGR02265 family)
MNATIPAPPAQGLGSQQDLEQRLAVLRPKETTRGFLFSAAREEVKPPASAEAWKRCVAASGGGTYTAFFSYPVSGLLKLAYAAAWELSERHGGFEGAMQHLGFRAAPRFLDSTAGKMLMSLVGKDPKRLIEGLPSAYKTAWEHGACALEWTGPRSGRFLYRGNVIPAPYFDGSVRQVLSVAKLAQAQVRGRQLGLTECEVEFSW